MRKVKTISFLFVITIVPFIILEVVARTLFHPEPTLMWIPSNNFRLIYELNPVYSEINSLRMRQEELDTSKLRDYCVIAAIGDSHTYSLRSERRENSFPARLEYHLKALTDKKIKVLNLGVPGYNMAQELEVLRSKAMRLKPQLIILQYSINDEHISNYIWPKYVWLNRAIHQSVVLTRAWKTFLYSRFGRKYFFHFVEKYLPDLLLFSPGLVGAPWGWYEKDPAHANHPSRSKEQVPTRYHDFIGRENLERDVRIFGELTKKAGIPAIATGFIEDQDKSLYEASGFRVYSFFQMFSGLDMREYGYDVKNTSNHFSDRGSDLIGKALAEFIKAYFSTLLTEGLSGC